MTIQRIKSGAAVVHSDTACLAGQVTRNTAGGSVAEQTKDIRSIIDTLLAEAGTDKTKLLMPNIWLTAISTFAELNAAWDAWVAAGQAPARATVDAKLA
ncbi:MAG: RidA family protein, partial [Mesorhizobium sp.]